VNQGFVPQPPPARPERGPLLTILLGLVTFGSLFGIASALLFFKVLHRVAERQLDPTHGVSHAKKVLTVMLLASVVELVCAVGMWMWKQWGVFGYVGMALLQLFLSSRLNEHHQVSYVHMFWVVLVVAAALPKWDQFEH
jgi:uncharacterized membrane protein (DUF2068 family)